MPLNDGYYERLGISKNATDVEIREAFRSAARRLHPDVNIEAGATELFLNIKEAYDVLTDPTRRSAYDGNFSQENVLPPPVRIDTLYSQSSLAWLNGEQLHYALIDLKILEDQLENIKEENTPTNIALVIDNSTSMEGDRLSVAKASAIEIIRRLGKNDTLSILTFNDRSNIVLPAAPYANNVKSEGRVRILQASGGTEIFSGLAAGLSEVDKNLSPYYINHVILLTDGHTYGDEDKCLNLARVAAQKGIGISCLGIGSEWNDEFLDSLASATGGSSFFVQRPSDILNLVKQKFNRLGQVVVERIGLNLVTGAGVELNYAFRLQPEAHELPKSFPQKLGNLYKGSSQTILLEFIIAPIAPSISNLLLAEGNISFLLPKKSETIYRIPINLVRPIQVENSPQAPPKKIVEAMSRLTLYRMQKQAKDELMKGNFQKAMTQLQYIATQLMVHGETKLAQTVLDEAQHIQNRQKFSADGDKKIKYGTRALLLPRGQRE